MLLRIAETVAAHRKTVSVFMLDYSYAPEARFPVQLKQCVAGYKYLVQERGVPAAKIAMMGDSAGGSLSLAFLTHRLVPLSSVENISALGKPGVGVFLISPWVSLRSTEGYAEKAESDVLFGWGLLKWAKMFSGESPGKELALYSEFTTPMAQRGSWETILPSNVRVWAGEDELFLATIKDFVRQARADGVNVKLMAAAGKEHDWQYVEATDNEKAFLDQDFGTPDSGLLPGANEIGDAVAESVA